MKLVRYGAVSSNKSNAETRYGILEGNLIHDCSGDPYESGLSRTGMTFDLDSKEVRLLAPSEPTKIVAVGKCYNEHISELGGGIPEAPVIFIKPSTCVNRHLGNIGIPAGFGRIDYEGELAFVIKKRAYRIKAADAAEYILGYTCFNDVTARDIQRIDGQWTRAKSFDGFAPFGPCIQTMNDNDCKDASSSVIDPQKLMLKTYKNGVLVQSACTCDMRWNVYEILEFITACMTLMPGDVVTTGTPSGIGPISSGDRVDVCIDGIGTLTNYVTY